MKALVIETAFLGDAILSLALAGALKKLQPFASITYLVRPESAELLRYAPDVDHVIAYDKYGSEAGLSGISAKAEELDRLGFDHVFSLHESRRTGLLLEKLNIPRKIGFGNFSALTDKVNASPGIQRTARAVTLLRILDSHADITTLPRLDVTSIPLPDELMQLPQFVALAPGSVWRTKRWPADRFASLAERYFQQGLTPIFLGSKQDLPAMLEVRRTLAVPHVDLVGRTSIPQVAAIIAKAAFVVANDSAPVHMATAVRTPSVVVFGPTVRQFGFAPPEELGVVVEYESLWCRPCTSHGSHECPIHTHECMTRIGTQQVLEASRRFAEFNGF